MLTFEEIEDCFPHGSKEMEDGITGVNAQWLHDFAHAVAEKEREACAKVCDDVFAELGKYDGSAADICGDKIRERSNVG